MAPVPPQSRRYLRSAPRPESWAEIQDAVLDQLGGSDRAEATLRATLERLRESHPRHQQSRTGPGRKSNGEHALNFYEYLLEEALPAYREKEKQNPSEKESSIDDDDDGEEAEENDGEDSDSENGDDDDEAEEEEGEEDMTVEESANESWEHNDLCEVCDGDATERHPHIQCSSCPLVFHLDCVRPPVENNIMPDDEPYVCSYCVMAQGLPVSSKPRRVAAAAVRLMARLRKRKIRERQERGEFNQKEMEERRHLGLQVNEVTEKDQDETGNTLVDEGEVELDGSQAENESKAEADFDESMEVEEIDEKVESAESKPAEQSDVPFEEAGDGKDEEDKEEDKEEEEAGDDGNAAVAKEDPQSEVHEDGQEDTEKSKRKDEHTDDTTVSARKSREAGANEESLEEIEGSGTVKTNGDGADMEINVAAMVDSDASRGEDKDHSNKMTAARSEGEQKAGSVAGRVSPRRNRKRPTIYNPHVVKKKVETSGTTEGVASSKESTSVSARKAALDDDDAVWCNFCKDDADILICVFCACRVCFGKHHEKKLLICDQCDEEYHTFCLDPPLDSVPDSKWFCPNCVEESTKKSVDSQARRTSRERRSVSKKTPDPKRSPRETPSKTNGTQKSLNSKNNLKPGKSRGPGRPPKNASPTDVVATAPRKRGRPPKNPASAESDRPRKRGRPSKSDSFSKRSQSEPPRKRGRPPSAKTLEKRAKEEAESRKAFKAAEAAKAASAAKRGGEHMSEADVRKALAAAAAAAAVAKPPPPVTKSRSGRTVKRITHYEEMGHGMQMLQTARLMEHLKADPTAAPSTLAAVAAGEPGSQSSVIPGSVYYAIPPARSLADSAATGTVASASGSQRASVLAAGSLKPPPEHATTAASAIASTAVPVTDLPAAAAADGTFNATMSTRGALNPTVSATQSATAYASRVDSSKQPRRKPGARECMQISRRFGVKEIPEKYIEILMDYKDRGKLEHLIRMRERLDEHSRFLEAQLAGLEALVLERGESSVVVPLAPPSPERSHN